jgi:hypothetical protein
MNVAVEAGMTWRSKLGVRGVPLAMTKHFSQEPNPSDRAIQRGGQMTDPGNQIFWVGTSYFTQRIVRQTPKVLFVFFIKLKQESRVLREGNASDFPLANCLIRKSEWRSGLKKMKVEVPVRDGTIGSVSL